jgi:hypothetical protein
LPVVSQKRSSSGFQSAMSAREVEVFMVFLSCQP